MAATEVPTPVPAFEVPDDDGACDAGLGGGIVTVNDWVSVTVGALVVVCPEAGPAASAMAPSRAVSTPKAQCRDDITTHVWYQQARTRPNQLR